MWKGGGGSGRRRESVLRVLGVRGVAWDGAVGPFDERSVLEKELPAAA